MKRVILAAALAAALSAACQNDLDGLRGVSKPGIDPPTDRLFFPTGLAVAGGGRYLLVANSNADIKYNGSVISVVDLMVANARFSSPGIASCRQSPQNRYIVECDEGDGLMLEDAAVRVGNFPAYMALLERSGPHDAQSDGGFDVDRLYMAVRGNSSVTFLDLRYDEPTEDGNLLCLTCGSDCSGGLSDCDDDHVVSEAPQDAPFVTEALPEEPYGLFVDPALRLLYVTHLSSGAVSLFDLSQDDRPVLRQVLDDVLDSDINGARGGFGVLSLDPGDPDAPVFVASRTAPLLVALHVQDGAVEGDQCASGFCHGRICSQCSSREDCPGEQECAWSPEAQMFTCQGGAAALGDPCSPGDCASGFCVDGVCSECAGDEDCAGAGRCVLDGGVLVCQGGEKRDGALCDAPGDCASGFCTAGRCSSCGQDADCKGTMSCRRTGDGFGGWFFSCRGGMGPDGASCFDGQRSITSTDTMLALESKLYLTSPLGPMEATTSGDIRGIDRLPDGSGLVAVSRVPPALVVLDTSEQPDQWTGRYLDAIELCQQPSLVKVRSFHGWVLAYVTCWASGQVFVLDVDEGRLVSSIAVGKGPHDIVFAPDEPWIVPELRYRAYVSNFAENTISVIDLDPSSPTWNQVIGKIGWPEEAVDQ